MTSPPAPWPSSCAGERPDVELEHQVADDHRRAWWCRARARRTEHQRSWSADRRVAGAEPTAGDSKRLRRGSGASRPNSAMKSNNRTTSGLRVWIHYCDVSAAVDGAASFADIGSVLAWNTTASPRRNVGARGRPHRRLAPPCTRYGHCVPLHVDACIAISYSCTLLQQRGALLGRVRNDMFS